MRDIEKFYLPPKCYQFLSHLIIKRARYLNNRKCTSFSVTISSRESDGHAVGKKIFPPLMKPNVLAIFAWNHYPARLYPEPVKSSPHYKSFIFMTYSDIVLEITLEVYGKKHLFLFPSFTPRLISTIFSVE
jgi:hypothetical protein